MTNLSRTLNLYFVLLSLLVELNCTNLPNLLSRTTENEFNQRTNANLYTDIRRILLANFFRATRNCEHARPYYILLIQKRENLFNTDSRRSPRSSPQFGCSCLSTPRLVPSSDRSGPRAQYLCPMEIGTANNYHPRKFCQTVGWWHPSRHFTRR